MTVEPMPTSSLGEFSADPAAQVAKKRAAGEAARQAEIDKIKKMGFSAYVQEMQEEKIKAMREEILRAMGLTEEDLGKMSAEARSALEKRIDDEIQKRLAANSSLNGDGKRGSGRALGQMVMDILQNGGAGAGVAGQGGGMTAPGPSSLISVQEVGAGDETRTGATADVKDSRERGRGLPV